MPFPTAASSAATLFQRSSSAYVLVVAITLLLSARFTAIIECQSGVEALVELYKASLSLLNHMRELCENQAGNFADWRELEMP
jgi:hypothetical protein